MARKFVITPVRLEKKFEELYEKGFKFQHDLITCNKDNYFCDTTLKTFKNERVDEEYLAYPISEIQMFFYSKETSRKCTFTLYAEGVGKMEICEESYSLRNWNSLEESNEFYSLSFGDDIPESGLNGERLSSFNLLLPTPFFNSLLKSNGLYLENGVLWSIFNNDKFTRDCESCGRYWINCIPKSLSSDLMNIVKKEKFSLAFVKKYVDLEVVTYKSIKGDCHLSICMADGIYVWYYDDYMDAKKVNSFMLNTDMEGVDITNVQKYEIGYMGESVESDDCISTFAHDFLKRWKYKSIMLNNDVNDALFKFHDVRLEELLKELEEDNYRLDNIGFVNVRSMTRSVTVCGFKNSEGYLYIAFYYGSLMEVFLMNILSSNEKLTKLSVEDEVVILVDVNVTNSEDVTTFIRGFDFSDFEVAGLN